MVGGGGGEGGKKPGSILNKLAVRWGKKKKKKITHRGRLRGVEKEENARIFVCSRRQ